MEELTLISKEVAEMLVERGDTIAVAETSAGGLLSASPLAVPGASAYYLVGGVLYTHQSRELLLGIPDTEMKGIRSSSEPYAQLLAISIRTKFNTTWGISETGAAGPTGNRYGDNPGHTCVSVSGPINEVKTVETNSQNRTKNMMTFSSEALNLLKECLLRA